MSSSWYNDLTSPLGDSSKPHGQFISPPGFVSVQQQYSSSTAVNNTATTMQHTKRALQKRKQETDELKLKRAQEQAFSPAKSIPMNLLMSYFSGSSLQVITLSMTWMMFFNGPIKQIATMNDLFSKLETENNGPTIFIYKVVYCFFLLATMGVGVYKLAGMGILPNTASDWVAWETPSKVLELAF